MTFEFASTQFEPSTISLFGAGARTIAARPRPPPNQKKRPAAVRPEPRTTPKAVPAAIKLFADEVVVVVVVAVVVAVAEVDGSGFLAVVVGIASASCVEMNLCCGRCSFGTQL